MSFCLTGNVYQYACPIFPASPGMPEIWPNSRIGNSMWYFRIRKSSTLATSGSKSTWPRKSCGWEHASVFRLPTSFFRSNPISCFPDSSSFPLYIRAFLLTRFALGNYERIRDFRRAVSIAGSIHLLARSRLRRLFPEARIERARFLGLTKSFRVSGEGCSSPSAC